MEEGGGPQIGEVTCGGSPHLSCKRDQIKMRDFMDRRVTQQSELRHLPGVPHLHINRPLVGTYGRYIISVVISRTLWVAAIMKTGKATSVMSKYYRPKDLLRDLFLLLIKIRHILFLSPVIRRPKKPVKPGLQYRILQCNR